MPLGIGQAAFLYWESLDITSTVPLVKYEYDVIYFLTKLTKLLPSSSVERRRDNRLELSVISPRTEVDLNQNSVISPCADVDLNKNSVISPSIEVDLNKNSVISPSTEVYLNKNSVISPSTEVYALTRTL